MKKGKGKEGNPNQIDERIGQKSSLGQYSVERVRPFGRDRKKEKKKKGKKRKGFKKRIERPRKGGEKKVTVLGSGERG